MKITSVILGALSKAVGIAGPPYETMIDVPPQIQPICSLRSPVGQTGQANTPCTSSASNIVLTTVANAGGNAPIILTMTRGLWELSWSCFYTANYIDVGVTATGSLTLVGNTGLRNIILAAFQAAGAGAQSNLVQFGKLVVNLDDDTWLIRNNVAANGVGQTHSLLSSVTAHKLT